MRKQAAAKSTIQSQGFNVDKFSLMVRYSKFGFCADLAEKFVGCLRRLAVKAGLLGDGIGK